MKTPIPFASAAILIALGCGQKSQNPIRDRAARLPDEPVPPAELPTPKTPATPAARQRAATTLLSERDRNAILSRTRHRLTFEKTGPVWTLSNVAKTTSRLNDTEISFVLDRVPIGKGDSGLANLKKLIHLLPPSTVITAEHHLACGENRWSEKIRTLRKWAGEHYKIDIRCDGAF